MLDITRPLNGTHCCTSSEDGKICPTRKIGRWSSLESSVLTTVRIWKEDERWYCRKKVLEFCQSYHSTFRRKVRLAGAFGRANSIQICSISDIAASVKFARFRAWYPVSWDMLLKNMNGWQPPHRVGLWLAYPVPEIDSWLPLSSCAVSHDRPAFDSVLRSSSRGF